MEFLKWLLSILETFISKSKPSVPPIPIKEEGKVKKIAVLVGHGQGDPGAIAWNKVQEHSYNSKVADILTASDLGKDIRIFYKAKNGWLQTYGAIKEFKPDLSIELHLNAATRFAVGCEVLCHSGDEKSAVYGRSFAKAFTQKFNRKLRRESGINFVDPLDRGYANLKGARGVSPISILVEPFFCDNVDEWIELEVYAEFLKEWIKGL